MLEFITFVTTLGSLVGGYQWLRASYWAARYRERCGPLPEEEDQGEEIQTFLTVNPSHFIVQIRTREMPVITRLNQRRGDV